MVGTRLIGEPPWAIGHEAQVRDWARHESVINVAFADRQVTFICPYDAQALPTFSVMRGAPIPRSSTLTVSPRARPMRIRSSSADASTPR